MGHYLFSRTLSHFVPLRLALLTTPTRASDRQRIVYPLIDSLQQTKTPSDLSSFSSAPSSYPLTRSLAADGCDSEKTVAPGQAMISSRQTPCRGSQDTRRCIRLRNLMFGCRRWRERLFDLAPCIDLVYRLGIKVAPWAQTMIQPTSFRLRVFRGALKQSLTTGSLSCHTRSERVSTVAIGLGLANGYGKLLHVES